MNSGDCSDHKRNRQDSISTYDALQGRNEYISMTHYAFHHHKPESTQASNGFLALDNRLKMQRKGRSRFHIDIGMRKSQRDHISNDIQIGGSLLNSKASLHSTSNRTRNLRIGFTSQGAPEDTHSGLLSPLDKPNTRTTKRINQLLIKSMESERMN